MVQVPAACVTSARLSLSAMPPRRVTGSPLAATRYSIEPSPCPLLEPEMLSQPTSDAADHAHSRAVVTVMRPLPPSAGTVASIPLSVTPQRAIVDGAVTVDVDDPQPLTTAAVKNTAPIGAERKMRRSPIPDMAGVAATAEVLSSKKVPGSCCYDFHLNSRLASTCHFKN